MKATKLLELENKNGQREKNIIAQNKKALRDFFIIDRYDAGIVLLGSEVKSIRNHKVNLKDSYARIKKGEIFLYNMHISPYAKGRIEDLNPTRIRKLLLHRKEIDRIAGKMSDRSLTIVPLNIYIQNGLVKTEIALAKGKLKRDKRRDIEKKETEREMKRAMKYKSRQ